MNGQQGPNVGAGTSVTEGFGSMALAKSAETASSALAAQAQAIVQARFIMAMKNPRDIDVVRQKLMKECRRPGFAEVARYHKPIGRGVTGPSIRFAETAMRCMGNIDTNSQAVFDSPERRIIRVTVGDLESNVAFAADISVDKTVERSRVPEGETPLGTRTNSLGRTTYLLAATEDDLLNKQNALVSKAIRTLGLRLVPGDLIDEGMQTVVATQEAQDKADPEGARKRLLDTFASIGVPANQLKDYVGHDLLTLSPAEGTHLRALVSAIREGEATWREAYEKRMGKAEGEKADGLKERIKAKAPKAEAPSPAPRAEAAKPAKPGATSKSAPAVNVAPPAPVSSTYEREPGDDTDDIDGSDYAEADRIDRGLS